MICSEYAAETSGCYRVLPRKAARSVSLRVMDWVLLWLEEDDEYEYKREGE
jgi:hypothetical protein